MLLSEAQVSMLAAGKKSRARRRRNGDERRKRNTRKPRPKQPAVMATSEVVAGNRSWLPTLRPRDRRVTHRRLGCHGSWFCRKLLDGGTERATQLGTVLDVRTLDAPANRGVSNHLQVPRSHRWWGWQWQSGTASRSGSRFTRACCERRLLQSKALEQQGDSPGGQSNLPAMCS
jgi:hypothetical protein